MNRVGIGYDVHPFSPNRPLIIGGTVIPYPQGLAGHSDADVLVHALCDALLGALGSGDLGTHFPDSDPAFKGISSMVLLDRVFKMVREKGYEVQNLDVIILAEEPKMGPYKTEIRSRIAKALDVSETSVNIKATTQEGLGFIGRKEGIAAQAICSLSKVRKI
ncbi:MAG TPA: 2-C-methyl-D-erythritol 2,4-cyclodiphosphate synthase [Nitrospiria bacterium]|jgi:2-C-methyl-D-erythritol 2,4-cyclodiphosphate synthase